MFAPYLERYREWSPFVLSWTKQTLPLGMANGNDLSAAAS